MIHYLTTTGVAHPIALREAEIVWDGSLATGTGTLSSGSSALGALAVTWASRTEQPGGKASPEELIAAAHASCFAMALALVLGENHAPPERLALNATCMLDEVDGAPRITTIALNVRAHVPGLEQAEVAQRHSGGRPLPGFKRAARKCRDRRTELARPMRPARLRRPFGTSSLISEPRLPQTSHVTQVRR